METFGVLHSNTYSFLQRVIITISSSNELKLLLVVAVLVVLTVAETDFMHGKLDSILEVTVVDAVAVTGVAFVLLTPVVIVLAAAVILLAFVAGVIVETAVASLA